MSKMAAMAYARKMNEHNLVLAEALKNQRTEIVGALQMVSYLVQKFGTNGTIIVPRNELAEIGGGVRVKENEDDTVTLIAVTNEQIQQAGAEMQKNAEATGGEDVQGDVQGGGAGGVAGGGEDNGGGTGGGAKPAD